MVASSYQYGPERLALVSSELDELSIAHEETVDTYCDSPLDPARRTAASDGFYEDGLDDEGHGMRRREGLVREGSFEASSAVPNGGDGVVFRSASSNPDPDPDPDPNPNARPNANPDANPDANPNPYPGAPLPPALPSASTRRHC